MSIITSEVGTRPASAASRPVRAPLAAAGDLVRGLHQRRLLVVVVFLTIFSFDIARPTDIDFWWHLTTGAMIARDRMVPHVDPFSYTALGRAWVDHEWLWELIAYWVMQLGGYRLAVLISSTIVALTYALVYRLLRQLGVNELVSAVVVLVAAFLAVPSIGVRPRELTLLFLAYYVSRLFLYRGGRIQHLWGLPVVMALWANLHGAFVYGLGVLAIFVVGEIGQWLVDRKPVRCHLLVVGLTTVAATVLNPDGPKFLLYPFNYLAQHDNPSFSTVTEFQSPDFHQPIYLVFAASLILLMVLSRSRSRLDVVDSLLLAGFAGGALISERQVADYAIVAAPLLALRLRDSFGWARELRAVRFARRTVVLNWSVLLALLASAVVYASAPSRSAHLQLGIAPSTDSLPVAGVDFIEREHLPGPIFNYQLWGGYLVYRWYPSRPVFVDGRVDMYGTEIIQDYQEVALVKPGWKLVLDKYGVQTILVDKGSALSTLLLADGGWQRVFQGSVEDVFVRRR